MAKVCNNRLLPWRGYETRLNPIVGGACDAVLVCSRSQNAGCIADGGLYCCRRGQISIGARPAGYPGGTLDWRDFDDTGETKQPLAR